MNVQNVVAAVMARNRIPLHAEPTGEQKREYLRLLLTEGSEAAHDYLAEVTRPGILIFESEEERQRYKQAGGRPPRISVVLPG